MITSFVAIVLLQPFPQTPGFHPNNRIFLGVKVWRSAESIHGDAVFFDLVGHALKVSFTNIAKELGQARGTNEISRTQDRLKLVSFEIGAFNGLLRFHSNWL